jgi:hypothetical protein
MTEENKISEVVEEIKGASEEDLNEVIQKWFEETHTSGLRWGAYYISAAVAGAIEKNLKKGSQSSLRDYQRAIKRITEIVSVQLTKQNDLATEEIAEQDGDEV